MSNFERNCSEYDEDCPYRATSPEQRRVSFYQEDEHDQRMYTEDGGSSYYHHVNEQLHDTFTSSPDAYSIQNAHQDTQTYAEDTFTESSTTDIENQCHCEYLSFGNFKWIKKQHYAVVRDGREYFERYVVTYTLPNSHTEHDMFTYAEGLVKGVPIENRFSHMCGEVLSVHSLPPVNSLENVCYYTPPSIDSKAPFHVQEEVCKTKNLIPVPLKIDTTNQVLVFRTFNNSLALQLMPTAFSERSIISGTPLFHGIRKTICATVGSTFSEFHYVINGSPCLYTVFSIAGKEKHESSEGDRMRLVVLDRRDRFDSEEWVANETVLNSVSDVALPVLQRYEGKRARLDVRDIMYVGVVNNNLQLTDAPSLVKKYKPPKTAVVTVIDNRGVYAVQIKDKEILNQWVAKDAKVMYSILPRRFFDKPRSSIVRINTADTNAKLKRVKSREVLI